MLRGLVRLVVLACAVVCLSWAAGECAPGDVRERAARAAGLLPEDSQRVSDATRQRAFDVMARRGVPAGAAARLGALAAGLVHGDLPSWRDGRPALGQLAEALPTTLELLGLALLLSIVVGGAGALLAAERPARVVRVLASVGLALPTAWLAVVALRALVWGHPFALGDGLVIPSACLAVLGAAVVARVGRAALVEALARPEILAARARGLGGWRLMLGHAVPLARAPLLATLPALVAALLGGAAVVERAFDLPGAGALLTTAAAAGDVPVVTVCALLAALTVGLAAGVARR